MGLLLLLTAWQAVVGGARAPSLLGSASWSRTRGTAPPPSPFPNITCPCDPQFCRALRTPLPKKEVHIYHVGYVGDGREWKHYDWSQKTTICIFGHEGYVENPQGYMYAPLLCHAHQRGVRVTFGGGLINEPDWGDKAAMQATIDEKLAELTTWGFDGINIDIEQAMQNASQAARLLDTVVTITKGLKAEMPWLSTSFAVGFLGSDANRVYDRHWHQSFGGATRTLKHDDIGTVITDDLERPSPPHKKLVVFYNGWRLLDNCGPSNWGATCVVNHGHCRKMVGLGFNVAVVMIYTPPSALRGLALCGMVPWVAIGNNMHTCDHEKARAIRPAPFPECCNSVKEPEPADYRSFCAAHISSPFLNQSAYRARVRNATDTLQQLQGWAAGALDDIEQPPWPQRSYSAAGLPQVFNFTDLEQRLGNQPSASAPEWPSFTDWPTANAHRLPNGRALTIEAVQYNDPQRITTAQPAEVTWDSSGPPQVVLHQGIPNAKNASAHELGYLWSTGPGPPDSAENSVVFGRVSSDLTRAPPPPSPGTAGVLSIAGKGNISMISQPFQLRGDHTRLTRVDLWLQRSIPGQYPAAWLSFSICEVDSTTGLPMVESAILCAQRSPPNPEYPQYFRSAGLYATCGYMPSDMPVKSSNSWSPTSLYVDPAVAALDPAKTYAIVLQFAGKKLSLMASSPASYEAGTQNSPSREFDAMAFDSRSSEWHAVPGVALRVHLFAPADEAHPNRLHADWVSFHASTTAHELRLFADVAKTIKTYNSTGLTMDVVAYSAYAGVGMGPARQANYLGDVREEYGVDWSDLAQAGLTVAMCGYGAQDIRPTRSALAAGARTASPPANKPPLLVCSCKSSQDVFTKEYEMCDGAMEFESRGGSTPFNRDFNFHVPK
eukprot:SAG22_NODE_1384_length_4534_cov_2.266516_4_plen_889_part_01